jgi:LuxR family maltose regulon positive regulatory protein
MILISAPAGFGKTTLVSEWISGSGKQVAWLSLDEGDNDPIRFLTYFTTALHSVAPDIGKAALAVLQSPQPPSPESILISLLNEITTLPNDVFLVLDDYHLIDSKSVDGALGYLLDHLPPLLHLVITTREDPSLPLSRYRTRGQMIELRAADLRFTPAEAADFLNRVMDLHLTPENISTLETRTEGWIAGLQMAALSIQGLNEPSGFIQSFSGSHRFVLDYLLEEVLQRQTTETQNFLLRASILTRLCGSLCNAVLGSPPGSSQSTLEYLERANLFIIPLDNERRWYRYHHLFAELLRQRLGNPDDLPELHLRASKWYEEHGDLAEAFQHALTAGDHRRAAELAESASPGMQNSFQSSAWLGWAKKLPEETIRTRPVLSTWMAQAYMDAGEPAASESRLQDAEHCLNGPADEMAVSDQSLLQSIPAIIAMTRAYNAQVQGDLSGTVRYAKLALQLTPEDDIFRRAQATITLEVTHWTRGDLESARTALVEWMTSMRKAGNFPFVVASAFALADILVELGRLLEAKQTYQQAIDLALEHGEDARNITAHHHLGLAMLFHEASEDSAAAEHLQIAQELGKQTTLVDWSYRWHIAQARLLESRGDLKAALLELDDASRAYVKTPIPDVRPTEALKAKVYLKQGRLDKARDWARARSLKADGEISYLNEFEHLTLARILIAEYQIRPDGPSIKQAIELSERLLKAAETQNRSGSVIEILVVLAIAYQVQGDLSRAQTALEHALTLAESKGYLRTFVDEGEPVRLLLQTYRTQGLKQSNSQGYPLRTYVDRLLSAFDRTDAKQKSTHPKQPEMIEPLSDRELEVLHLLAQGLTNQDISQRLVLALSTVKGHNLRIFAKLQAKNRSEAVLRARELGLL